jgi:dUTP pyrophosphatase
MKVAFKKLSDKAVIPKYAIAGDAGLDLVATSYKYENGRHVYGTDLAIEVPEGFVGLIFPRSSIANYDLRLSNAVGVIDSNFRGEITFKFENDRMQEREQYLAQEDITIPFNSGLIGDTRKTVLVYAGNTLHKHKIYEVGNRIGQLVIMPIPTIEPVETKSLSQSNRGTGAYGSSGV